MILIRKEANSDIKVILTKPNLTCQVSFDSQDKIIFKGKKELIISKNTSPLTLIHPLGHDFFGACRNKLGWSMSMVKSSI